MSKKRTYTYATASHFPTTGPMAPNGKEVLVSAHHVNIDFGKGDKVVHAVKDACFDIYKGETLSFVGESGSGKTTLGRAIIRANTCSAGEILYKGVRINGKIPRSLDREVVRNIQMVFQDPATSLNERATVDYIVSEGLYNFHLYKDDRDRLAKVEKIIEDVGLLPEHLTRYPHEFSGGQRQRVGLARAMVMEPELVVADEPISALDVSIRAQILNLMNKFKQERNTTYLFIAHDLSIVRYISDRIAVIYKGNIVELADSEELFNYPLHPYTRSLISAIPLPDPKLEKNKQLFTYDPTAHGYTGNEELKLRCIGGEHYVYGSEQEAEAYRKQRETNVPMKILSIIGENTNEALPEKENVIPEESILERPINDTGNVLLLLLSFLLPLVGLLLGLGFKKRNYMRNYKQCRKGAIAGFICFMTIVLFFGILLLLVLRPK